MASLMIVEGYLTQDAVDFAAFLRVIRPWVMLRLDASRTGQASSMFIATELRPVSRFVDTYLSISIYDHPEVDRIWNVHRYSHVTLW